MRRPFRLIFIFVAAAAAACGSDKPIDVEAFMPLPTGYEVVNRTNKDAAPGGAFLAGSAMYFVVTAPDGTELAAGNEALRTHLLSNGFVEAKKGALRQSTSGAFAHVHHGSDNSASPPGGAKPFKDLAPSAVPDKALVLTVTQFNLG